MHWFPVLDGDDRARALYLRHYSARHYRDGRKRSAFFVGPGEKMVLLTVTCDALFIWRHSLIVGLDKQEGVCCAIFRNEGPILSSTLIQEADELAWLRWPGLRHYTYVADRKIRSTNPGACFRLAGWRVCGRNATGKLTILERLAVPYGAKQNERLGEQVLGKC